MSYSTEPVARLYDEVESIISNKKIDAGSMISVVTLLMKTVDKYTDVNGIQKKEVVLAVLRKIIEETVKDESERQNILYLADQAVPAVIDTIVSIDKGQLKIKIEKGCKKLTSCCP